MAAIKSVFHGRSLSVNPRNDHAPEWNWFWHHVHIAVNFNYGNDPYGRLRDFAKPGRTWTETEAETAVMTGSASSTGRYLTGANDGFDHAVLTPSETINYPSAFNAPQSIFALLENYSRAGSDARLAHKAGFESWFGGDGSNLPSVGNAVTRATGSTDLTSLTGPFSMSGHLTNTVDASIYVNGALEGTASGGANFGALDISRIFGVDGSRGYVGDIYCLYLFDDYELSPAQHKQLHDDPNGPFRTNKRRTYFIPATPAAAETTSPFIITSKTFTPKGPARSATEPLRGPSARGLTGAWLLNGTAMNLITNVGADRYHNILSGFRFGGWDPGGATTSAIELGDSTRYHSGEMSCLAVLRKTADGAIHQICTADSYTDAERSWQFRFTATNKVEYIPFVDGSNGSLQGSREITVADGIVAVGFTHRNVSSNNIKVFEPDGTVTTGTKTTGATYSLDVDNANLGIGALLKTLPVVSSSNIEQGNGKIIYAVFIWDRTLSDTEMQAAIADPYGRILGGARRTYFIPAPPAAAETSAPFIITSKSRAVPYGASTKLNRNSPLTRNLHLAAVPMNDTYVDLVGTMAGRILSSADLTVDSVTGTGLSSKWPLYPGAAGDWVYHNNITGPGSPKTATWSAWARCDATTGTHAVCGMGKFNDRGRFTLSYSADANTAYANIYTQASFSKTSSLSVTMGEIHHIVGTVTSAGVVTVYVNGVKGTPSTTTSGSMEQSNLLIGGRQQRFQSTGEAPFQGAIGPVCYWNRVLTDAEIYSLYDPQTRWDLYAQPRRILADFIPAAPAAAETTSPFIITSKTRELINRGLQLGRPDYSNPLARGICFLGYCGGSFLRNLVDGKIANLTTNASAILSTNRYGKYSGVTTESEGPVYDFGTYQPLTGDPAENATLGRGGITVMALARASSTSSSQIAISQRYGTGAFPFVTLYLNGAANGNYASERMNFWVRQESSIEAKAASGGGAIDKTVPAVYAGRVTDDGTTITAYAYDNGVQKATGFDTGFTDWYDVNQHFSVGGAADNTGNGMDEMTWVAAWNRTLTVSEVLALGSDPTLALSLSSPNLRRTYFIPGAAAAAETSAPFIITSKTRNNGYGNHIDLAAPEARHLEAAWIAEGGTMRATFGAGATSETGTISHVAHPSLKIAPATGLNQNTFIDTGHKLVSTTDYSVVYKFRTLLNDATRRYFAFAQNQSGQSGYDWGFYHTDGSFVLYFKNGGALTVVSPLSLNTDYSVAASYRSGVTNGARIFVNGSLVAEGTITGAAGSSYTTAFSRHWGTTKPAQVISYDARIYSKALSDPELMAISSQVLHSNLYPKKHRIYFTPGADAAPAAAASAPFIITSKSRAVGTSPPKGAVYADPNSPVGDFAAAWPLFTGNVAELRTGRFPSLYAGSELSYSVAGSSEGPLFQARAPNGDGGSTAYDTGSNWGLTGSNFTVSSWWNELGDYLNGDDFTLLSNKPATNVGFHYGHKSIELGPPGYNAKGRVLVAGVADRVSSVGLAPARGWHLVTLTYDGTNFRWYSDGVLKDTVASSYNTSSGNIWIFGEGTAGTKPWQHWAMSLVLWTRTLSDSEIYSLWDPQTRWSIYGQTRRTYFIPDVPPITLSNGVVTGTNPVSASVDSNTAGGILYMISQLDSIAEPTGTQIKAGQDGAGGTPVHSDTIT